MASDYTTPWALVDSADPGVQYTGNWLQVNGLVHIFINYSSTDLLYGNGLNPSENLVQPFKNISFHAELSPANSFSYAFNGTGVAVFGSVSTTTFDALPLPPIWQCFVDTIPITLLPNLAYFGQGDPFALCAVDSLEDELHVLTLNLTESSITQFESAIYNTSSFYVDKIAYMPSLNLGDATEVQELAIPSSNAQIQYGPGWELQQDCQLVNVHSTRNSSSSVTINFEGISLAWFAQSQTEYGDINATSAVTPNASYSIDGQDPVIFPTILQSQTNDITACPILFNISQLAPGPHKLEVIFLGKSNLTSAYPLALTYVLIGNGSHILSGNKATSTSSTSPDSSTPTSPTPADGHNPMKTKTKKISISVASALTLLTILFAGVFYLRRNRKRKALTVVHRFPTVIGHKDESEASPNSPSIPSGVQNQRKGSGPMDDPRANSLISRPPAKQLHTLATTSTLQVVNGQMTSSSVNRDSSTAAPPRFSGISPLVTEHPPEYTAS